MRHFIKKVPVWTSAALLGLLLGAADAFAADVDACHEPPASPTQSIDKEFQRRLQIIEALEVTKDDERLSCLIQADINLDSYYVVLRRASASLQDPLLVDKLLNVPVLDKEAQNYRRVVSGVFSEIAANGGSTKQEIVRSLLETIKDDQKMKDDALRFIFETSAMHMPYNPDMEMTKRLVAAGANVEKAVTEVREQISKGQGSDMRSGIQHALGRLNRFHEMLISPPVH